MKRLGTLECHKTTCQCIVFAKPLEPIAKEGGGGEDSDEDDEMTEREKNERSRWLIAGSKDNRVSVWVLISFAKS
jgi:hypothetical protein